MTEPVGTDILAVLRGPVVPRVNRSVLGLKGVRVSPTTTFLDPCCDAVFGLKVGSGGVRGVLAAGKQELALLGLPRFSQRRRHSQIGGVDISLRAHGQAPSAGSSSSADEALLIWIRCWRVFQSPI